ncbi:MAG: RluA family pseudouridine synthase [Flavobacteriia bacterium]|nr:RluA family pseudouridine synthase [Flavobacteriia bacterium]OIP45979.1 MAG: RNA pseudouridine synthase [Flavobacteriaceae bacterium CG2_30_31_66]PIV95881.1 MAG: RNA pseudouridine synthase [Flavobacteriaceae bacterium CG17_big_fil_post_rev_8_21_14_2_50_31_13]PIX14325.1 MAG: RNA pseudouridine synthase [Flavobacteriaceae bacterium CG_4_8_14_3_um_filter_31_8]PIY15366.1 MAG: RNA pseudouridine synthase [Flavobacteriaceae bacterium CG_4_10_14_3_um_filter_31_253]PIZ11133.1 MAG: RNA pseudouridine s
MHSTKNNLLVLYEDNHIIIVNKRAGDITQGDKTGDMPLSEVVKDYLKDKYHKEGNVFLGVVHRLDRPTSGVIIFAKTSKSLERLNKMLRDKEIQKTYWAVVKNHPEKETGTLINFLKKNPVNNKSAVYSKEVEGSKKAVLHYKVVQKFDNYSLLEIDLETGRHHQIRSQLAAIGFPIKGDVKYGFSRTNKDASIHLHARKIEFVHPVSKELISIIAPTPDEVIWNECN